MPWCVRGYHTSILLNIYYIIIVSFPLLRETKFVLYNLEAILTDKPLLLFLALFDSVQGPDRESIFKQYNTVYMHVKFIIIIIFT